MTKRELIEALATYPDETPIITRGDYDLHATGINEVACDDWEHSTKTDEGEIPATVIGVRIGSRF